MKKDVPIAQIVRN